MRPGALALCLAFPALAAAQERPLIAIHDVTVVDVTDGSLLPHQTVIVEGDRIGAVGPAPRSSPVGAEVVDGTGRYLIPGLWDMHTHTLNQWEWAFPLHVANGVTGIRDLSTATPLPELRRLRTAVAEGTVTGPRFLTAGPLIDGPESRYDYLSVRTADEARAAVDSLHAGGVDFVKVYDTLPREAFFAVVEAAARHGLPVVGHVPRAVTPEEAFAAGLRSVEHASVLRGLCVAEEANAQIVAMGPAAREARGRGDAEALARLERRADSLEAAGYRRERCAAALVAAGTWITPTITLHVQSYLRPSLVPADSLFSDPQHRYVPSTWLARWRTRYAEAVARDSVRGATAARGERRAEIGRVLARVGDAHRGGARVLAGTDGSENFQVYGFNLHEELGWLVRAGLTPLEALQAATLGPALFLGRQAEMGTVEAGKLADLVLLDANPLDDIANTRRIRGVVLSGRYLDRVALDRLLHDAETTAAGR